MKYRTMPYHNTTLCHTHYDVCVCSV